MSRLSTTVVLLTAVSSSVPSIAQIQNGSFENGLAYAPPPSIFAPGTPAPWFATSFTPDLYDNSGLDGWGLGGIPDYNGMFGGMLAADGNRFIGFAASSGPNPFNESFAQLTAPLSAGQAYTMTASIAADDSGNAAQFGGPYNGRGEVAVLLNGSLIGFFTQNTASLTWETRSFSFIAPNSSTATFEFVAGVDPSNGNASYIGLDGIALIPTPGATAMLLLSGTLFARRRR
jgi:hypothetical protein